MNDNRTSGVAPSDDEKREAEFKRIADLAAGVGAGTDWLPTPENINALPEPLRLYIAGLETLCDPAGIVRENTLLKDCNKGLQAMYRKAVAAGVDVPALGSREDELMTICAQAYQVVGSLLSDLGKFGTPEAEKILDNLSQQRMVHDDVLPWPSYGVLVMGQHTNGDHTPMDSGTPSTPLDGEKR